MGKLRPLKRLALSLGDWRRLFAAIGAGLLWAAAFPKIGLAGLAFIAPGAMLGAAMGVDGRRAFRLGYVAGLTHFLVSLSWLLHIPVNKFAPFIGWLALSAFLALYSGTWVWLCWRIFPARLSEGEANFTSRLQQFAAVLWLRRALWGLTCAALWVAWEMGQGRIFTGFPWNFLGASQYRQLPLTQMASVTGVYGVSFAAVWFSVALMSSVARLAAGARQINLWKSDVALPLLVGVCVVAWGVRASVRAEPTGAALKLALIQPSIPQRWIWDPGESSNRFAQLLQLSGRALADKPDLVVWPEAAVPRLARWDEETHRAITNFVRTHRVWLVLGSDDAEPARRPRAANDHDMFNAAFLISPDGDFVAGYRKQRLVMFGEFIPFGRWLPFIERWTGMGSFAAGDGPIPFELPSPRARMSVLICFEDVFPHLARRYVEDDTDFLLNLTNNGWFGESAAQWQHAASAVFRAVENGLPLVRCANNGITCWVDAQGRMHEEFFEGTKDIYSAGFKIVSVPLRGGVTRTATFYRRNGDVFGWACVAWGALTVFRAWRERRRTA